MKLVEFKSVDITGNEHVVFINPQYVESVHTHMNVSSIKICLISGNSVEINETLEKVKEKLGINFEGTDYKRTDKSH